MNQLQKNQNEHEIGLIDDALSETYRLCPWGFRNEAEFKHELFFRLGEKIVDGICLADAAPTEPSPRLHCEAKAENGNPVKADLLLCKPSKVQRFNYEVEHLIELKYCLTRQALDTELRKLDKYRKRYGSVFIAAAKPISQRIDLTNVTHEMARELRVVGPPLTCGGSQSPGESKSPDISDAYTIVMQCIEYCLWLYGNGRRQYQSHYWCNFEHETERRHSFPCEGDFNAQLYRQLRRRLPPSIRIYSEYKPIRLPKRRIDFVVADPSQKWAIPVEIKMNWDQFKPKYKNYVVQPTEVSTILARFDAVKHECKEIRPIMVVIQGHWRRETKMQNRRKALAELGKARLPLDLMMFDEGRNDISHQCFGRV